MKTIKQRLIDLDIPIDTHYSDLYCMDTPEARQAIRQHRLETAVNYKIEPFICQITGDNWLDLPGMNEDYFLMKQRARK